MASPPTRVSPVIAKTPADFRAACDAARRTGANVGFVPTMGALHAGHLALVTHAREQLSALTTAPPFIVVSIFVNPTQFGPNEDFVAYPRDFLSDVEKLSGVGVDLVFAPEASAMYPEGEQTRVRVQRLTEPLCGAFRPGHFEGVTTVVAKLFALSGPCLSVFGKKDYQQLAVLKKMVRDLFLPIELVGHPIVRETDGLAMSSRNAYLSSTERERALGLSRGLRAAWNAFEAGERDAAALRAHAHREVHAVADRIDYVEVLDPDELSSFASVPIAQKGRALLAIACHVGKTRLIDNVVLGEDPLPGRAS
ncbi:pantoate--beta-alanine ligase [Pendulispora rubella]|uniref:Pantothenate synthetase n=1 Tax=Pendulispora rubella TaxID=2741070 RepID=A0ABZ2LH73_9BACT